MIVRGRLLFVAAEEDPFLVRITAAIRERARRTQLDIVPGREHATDLLEGTETLAGRIAVWNAGRFADSAGGRLDEALRHHRWTCSRHDFCPGPTG